MSDAPRRAVFLDRDGVLNVYLPGDYVKNSSEMHLLPGAGDGVRLLNTLDLPVFVISNQQGVAKGVMTQDDLTQVDAFLHQELKDAGALVQRSYYCPHAANASCVCRKPKAGMLLQAAQEHNLDLASSFFVGDTETDAQAARAAGVGYFIFVLSGKYRDAAIADDTTHFPMPPDFVAADLLRAAQWIYEVVTRK